MRGGTQLLPLVAPPRPTAPLQKASTSTSRDGAPGQGGAIRSQRSSRGEVRPPAGLALEVGGDAIAYLDRVGQSLLVGPPYAAPGRTAPGGGCGCDSRDRARSVLGGKAEQAGRTAAAIPDRGRGQSNEGAVAVTRCSKRNDAADVAAAVHVLEGFVDLIESVGVRHEFVQL